MKIKSLTLENFRQFVGSQTLVFSTDDVKKITVVIGKSGYGKTTLIKAFQWLFFENQPNISTSQFNQLDYINQDFRNSEGSDDNELRVSVTAVLEYKQKEYTITRAQTFTKPKDKIVSRESHLTIQIKESNGKTNPTVRDADAQKIIVEIIPKDLFRYFFLEGESLNSVGKQIALGRGGSNSDFAKAVKGLLGFTFLHNAEDHLTDIGKEYTQEIEKLDGSTLSDYLKEEDACKETIKKDNARIESYKDQIDKYKDDRNEIEQQLESYSSVAAEQSKSKSLENDLSRLKNEINNTVFSMFNSFSTISYSYFAQSLFREAKDLLVKYDATEKTIPGIQATAIQTILNNGKCICGKPFNKDDDAYRHLQELLDYVPPKNLGTSIAEYLQALNYEIEKGKDFKNQFDSFRKTLNEKYTDFNAKNDEKQEIDKNIKENFSTDISRLKIKSEEYETQIQDLSKEIGRFESDLAYNENRLTTLQRKIETQKISNSKIKRLSSLRKLTDSLAEYLKKFYDSKEKEEKDTLEAEINNYYKQFYPDENIRLALTENYALIALDDSSGMEIKNYASGGQEVVLALTFIGSVVKRKATRSDPDLDDDSDEYYPLVMDAPVSNLGEDQIKSFCNILPRLTNQLIIFANDVGGPKIKDRLRSSIGKNYTIEKSSFSSASVKEED